MALPDHPVSLIHSDLRGKSYIDLNDVLLMLSDLRIHVLQNPHDADGAIAHYISEIRRMAERRR
jgi:hypothetical protein